MIMFAGAWLLGGPARSVAAPVATPAAAKPDIVVVMMDDLKQMHAPRARLQQLKTCAGAGCQVLEYQGRVMRRNPAWGLATACGAG
jgi:hypothetical protein